MDVGTKRQEAAKAKAVAKSTLAQRKRAAGARPSLKQRVGARSAGGHAASPSSRVGSRTSSGDSSDSSDDTSSGSDSDSDSDSDSVDQVEVEKAPLPAERPRTPKEAVRYDTIAALWLPRSGAVGDAARVGLTKFWEVVRTIRDRWKNDQAAVDKAQKADEKTELPMLQERVVTQRVLMAVALRNALEFGHPTMLEKYAFLSLAMTHNSKQ